MVNRLTSRGDVVRVTQVIDTEVGLETIFGKLMSRDGHYACAGSLANNPLQSLPMLATLTGIVDQNMEPVALGKKLFRGCLDAIQRVQLHSNDLDLAWLAIRQDVLRNCIASSHISHRDEDVGASQVDRFRDFLSEALRRAPRDQDSLAAPGITLVQALVFNDLGGRWTSIAWALGGLVHFSVWSDASHDCDVKK